MDILRNIGYICGKLLLMMFCLDIPTEIIIILQKVEDFENQMLRNVMEKPEKGREIISLLLNG